MAVARVIEEAEGLHGELKFIGRAAPRLIEALEQLRGLLPGETK